LIAFSIAADPRGKASKNKEVIETILFFIILPPFTSFINNLSNKYNYIKISNRIKRWSEKTPWRTFWLTWAGKDDWEGLLGPWGPKMPTSGLFGRDL